MAILVSINNRMNQPYSIDDILIIGDSFAAGRNLSTDWPLALVRKLTNDDTIVTARGKGFAGASWWSTRTCLLHELTCKKPKVLILTHTHLSRLASDYDFPLTVNPYQSQITEYFHNQFPYDKSKKKHYTGDVVTAAKMYYEHLFPSFFVKWAHKMWFTELDEILSEHDIEIVIHLHAFDTDWDKGRLYQFKTGITSKEILSHLFIYRDLDDVKDNLRNHFTEADNIAIATALYNTITEYTSDKNGKVIDLKLIER